jgi:hypothetical protein
VTEQSIPPERDLPAGRFTELKDELMAHIERDIEMEPRAAVLAATRNPRRLIGLTAAALVAGLVVAASLVVGGPEGASANTAERNAEGAIVITIREGRHPEELERRLTDLGVPADVEFLESGHTCDPARSNGWVQEPRGEELFTWAPTSPDRDPELVLNPDALRPGETAVFEFQVDEDGDKVAASVRLRLSTSPVGPCVAIPDGSVVDAEGGTAGG